MQKVGFDKIAKNIKEMISGKKDQIELLKKELVKLQSILNDLSTAEKGINRSSKVAKFQSKDLTERLIKSMDPRALKTF